MIYPKGTTEPKKLVASPAQTVAGKDFSNPLMTVDLPKAQQTQGTVDFPTNQTPRQTEIWDTLGEPSGKFDFLVKYSPSDSPSDQENTQTSSLDKEKKILQDSQDPDDDIISLNKLLSQIQKLQESPKNYRKFPIRKKKVVKKKKEDVGERFEMAISRALERVFPKKEDLKEKEIKECLQNPNLVNSLADDDEFGENENEGTNNSNSGMSFSPTIEHNLDT
ncbi:hypothetical protein Adt_30446 [Abeliophyllum distichum]|uniref:Uncharacterized protein n=1 Tax=Abeliophyllum distichum TaxID=126358 RepID=A0ABD1RBB3_9LAMI